VFFEASTRTLRQCPENYLLAYQVKQTGRYQWVADADKASPIGNHSLRYILSKWENGSTGAAMADAVEEAFWGRLGS
jgi:hypothetical protein